MLDLVAVVELENYIKLPELLVSQWSLVEGMTLYTAIRNKTLVLTKDYSSFAITSVNVIIGSGICLPDEFVSVSGVAVGSQISLVFENDVLQIADSSMIDFASPAILEDRLARKLKRELDIALQTPFGVHNGKWLEDIYHFLLLDKLDENVINRLLHTPSPLKKIYDALRNDDEFEVFLNKKLREKAQEIL